MSPVNPSQSRGSAAGQVLAAAPRTGGHFGQLQSQPQISWLKNGMQLISVLFAAIFLLYSCNPPASSSGGSAAGSGQTATKGGGTAPKKGLYFRDAAVVKSKNLYDTQRADQTYTNQLLLDGNPAAGTAIYTITKPAGYTGTVNIDPASGKITFQNAPGKFTVQATHAGKTASYTFTITGHFSLLVGRRNPRLVGRQLNGSLAVLNNTLYIIGGSYGSNLTDIWKSTDANIWTKVTTTSTAFTSRLSAISGYQVVAANGAIYLTGGDLGTGNYQDDVWKSKDGGKTWQESTTGTKFRSRGSHTAVALGAKIYVIGGNNRNVGRLNDVWESTGGDNWSEVNASTPNAGKFPARSGHSSVVISGGANAGIYVIGGFAGRRMNDVWRSTDGGVTWSQRTANAGFPARNFHNSVAVGQDIYVIGGFLGRTNRLNDVWKSTDGGANWTQVALAAGTTKFAARSAHGSAVLGSTMYVLGGTFLNRGNAEYLYDVWKSTDGATWKNVHAAP